MGRFIIICTLLVSFSAMAKKNYGEAYQRTIQANVILQEKELDIIGGKIVNRHDHSAVIGHCSKRSKISECEVMNYILYTQNKYFQLMDRNGNDVKVDLSALQGHIATEIYGNNTTSYNRQAGDFTGGLIMNCAYNRGACALLLLLPLSIAADLIMLPVDLAAPKISAALQKESRKTRYNSQIVYEEENDIKKISHKKFNLFLESELNL